MQNGFIDLSFLRDITGDKPEEIKHFLKLMVDSILTEEAAMLEAFEKQNWKVVRTMAHNLKSKSRYLGISLLETLLNQIEHEIREEETSVEQVKKLIDHTQPLLKKIVESVQSMKEIQPRS